MTTIQRNIFILVILTFFSWTQGQAKGDSGTYFVRGKAYGPYNSILRNAELRVVTGDSSKIITTDSEGDFEFEVNWETACATSDSKLTREEINNKMNADVRIMYKGQELTIKNEWKKFASTSVRTKENLTQDKDLVFEKY